MDTDNTGFIEPRELKVAIKNSNLENMSAEEIDSIIDQLDYDHNHKINYTEFISATINV